MSTEDIDIIPAADGIHEDIHEKISFVEEDDAADFFLIAKDRMLDVNQWQQCSGIPVSFVLLDHQKHPLRRTAHSGDIVHISGSMEQWLQVELVEYDDLPDERIESFAMRMRLYNSSADDHSSATFVILREDRKLTASVYSREERSNEQKLTTQVADRPATRHIIEGMANANWQKLVQAWLAE